MRGLVVGACVGLAVAVVSQAAFGQTVVGVVGVLGEVEVLHRGELPVRGEGPLDWELREVSAIEWVPSLGVLLAMGDDRSEDGPARVAVIEFEFDGATGEPVIGGLEWRALTAPGGGGFARDTVDPEGLRVIGARTTGPAIGAGSLERTVIAVASEGYGRGGVSPGVFEMDLGGFASAAWPAPATVVNGHPARGIDHNRGFEALAVVRSLPPTVYAGIEEPLRQDRPDSQTNAEPGVVRVVAYRGGALLGEYGFPLGPGDAGDEPGSHALAELVGLPRVDSGDRAAVGMLALENAKGADGTGRTRLSWTTPMGATNIAGVASLRERGFAGLHLMAKAPLVDFADLGIEARSDDWEGMTLGPVIGGRRTLVVCEDNAEGPNRIVVLALPAGL